MGQTTIANFGFLKVKLRENGIYYLAYKDRNTGKPILESTKQTNRQAALELAEKLNDQLSNARLLQDEYEPLLIRDAIAEAVRRTGGKTQAHKDNLLRYANHFGQFLRARAKGIAYLHQVKPQVLYDYIDYLAERELENGKKGSLKPKTIQHYLSVIMLTINHFSNLYPEHIRTFKLKMPKSRNVQKRYLERDQLLAVYRSLSAVGDYKTRAVFALGAFAGLNLQEIANVDLSHIDFAKGTLAIADSKNEFRTRTIPLLPVVLHSVAVWVHSRKHETECLFKQRNSDSRVTFHNLYKWIRLALERASETENDATLNSIAPKDLRKCFMNLAVQADCQHGFIEAYVGHSPKTVFLRHYADLRKADLLKTRILEPCHSYLLQAVPR